MTALITTETIGADPHYYLAHGDVYPRNILVEVTDNESVRFTGIIDWDSAQFAPAFMAYEVPCWLWKFDDLRSGFLEGLNLRIDAADEPQDRFDLEIKQAFDTVVGEAWLKVAYEKDAAVYRHIWQLMREGLWYSTQLYLAEDAIEELTGQPYEFRLRQPTDEVEDHGIDDEADEARSENGTGAEDVGVQVDPAETAESDSEEPKCGSPKADAEAF